MEPTRPARISVESWSPEYGSPVETAETYDPPPVDHQVETDRWRPLPGSSRDAPDELVFVDGVRRIEARLTLDDPSGAVPGVMAAFGVGAVVWDREARRSWYEGITVERLLIMAGGRLLDLQDGFPGRLRAESIPELDRGKLVDRAQRLMRLAEAELAARMAGPGRLVIADGTISDINAPTDGDSVGYIKRHFVDYLADAEKQVVDRLRAAERSPLFLIGYGRNPRYSWYVQLENPADRPAWESVVRCEVAASSGIGRAVRVADWTASLLPQLGSERHIDPRAPQNLVPIGALERELSRRLGPREYMCRVLGDTVHRHHSGSLG